MSKKRLREDESGSWIGQIAKDHGVVGYTGHLISTPWVGIPRLSVQKQRGQSFKRGLVNELTEFQELLQRGSGDKNAGVRVFWVDPPPDGSDEEPIVYGYWKPGMSTSYINPCTNEEMTRWMKGL